MILPLDLLLLCILIATAVLALTVRDLLTSVALLAAYSLVLALLFAGLSALDVSLVETALGAGLTGILLVTAIMATTRRSSARERPRQRWLMAPVIGAFVALMLFATDGLPDRGDPEGPQHTGVATHYLENALADTKTPNVVTALLADYRSLDTLGETLVILTAALGASLVLYRRGDRPEDAAGRGGVAGDVEGGPR